MELTGPVKRTTNRIGEISEAAIITRFLQLGYSILTPYGGKERCDLLIEDTDGRFLRVQCKTACLQDNNTVVAFNTASHNIATKNRKMRNYREHCDYFAVYCEELNKVYFIAVDEVGTTRANLRLVPAKNNQEKNVRWAKDYEL